MIELPVLNSNRSPAPLSGPTLVARLLAEQQAMSAVEEFSRWHEADAPRPQTRQYRSLLPATPPGPGEQYAFEVDLDRCSGCKACVVACHTLNGLDETETWRDVGLMVGGSTSAPVMQHVTTACHHCLEPACMIACPVNAYEKDAVTGIVKHLDDQCFGCQYCTLACPYEVPKYHAGLGIVRKCDMCSSRLAAGEAPACVQSCPHEAIVIRTVNRRQVMEDAETTAFLPATPDPQITLPTTSFKTKKPFPRNLLPPDYARVSAQHAHWPLIVMLVLTQLSVGAFCVGLALDALVQVPSATSLRPVHAVAALGFGLLALGSSLLHLGRPQYAFRAVLGLRHSWLSREIVAFGLFAGCASAYAAAVFLAERTTFNLSPMIEPLGWSVAATGAIAVFCSVMIYVFTQREYWSFSRVGARFALTCALLGIAAMWLSMLAATIAAPSLQLTELVDKASPFLCQALIVTAVAKLTWEAAIFRHLLFRRMTPLRRSAMLHTGELSRITLARFALGLLGGVMMPLFILNQTAEAGDVAGAEFVGAASLLFAACLAGELLERYLFFTACAAPRMPGGIR